MWAFLFACLSSSVCLSIRLSILLSLNNFFFNFFSRTTGPISTKLDTKHPWVKGIQVCSDEGPRPFPRGDNSEIVNLYLKFLKIFFSITTGPIWTKLGTKHSWVEGIQFCSNEGARPFLKGVNNEIAEIHLQNFKIFLQNHWANFNQTLQKAFLGERNSILFKWIGPPFSKWS